ncbi:MAG: alcohol dehydrogenase catalytic domain-containing protein [Anaerostipes sp.]|nr:alcohol dehydrogenase catalytic domain-containing protein [Anaerostipes sp.]
MKAIILNQPKDFSIKEINVPEIKDDEVLIEIKASGICTNDVRDFNGDCNYSYPRIGGHEYGGIIAKIGSGVNKNRFKEGQKVVQYIIDDCKECFYCKHGDQNICEEHQNSKIFHNPDGLSGYGGFAEYVVAKAEDLFVYPDKTSFEKMAFTEPLACVVNSMERVSLKYGDDVVVIGGGTMGLLHVILAKLKGARVILSEPLKERREKAVSLGCDDVIDPLAGDAVEAVKNLTQGRGGIAVFNTTAIPAIAAQAVDMTAPTGTTVMFSSIHPNEPVPVNMGAIHSYQKTITGAVSPTVSSFHQAVELIGKDIVDPTVFTGAIFDYEEFGQAIELAAKPDTYKVILKFGE